MEYVRSKLQINRHKNDTPHILFRKIAQEIAYETQIKLNISVDYELTLWLIRLLSLKPKYSNGSSRLFERAAVDALIKDYLQIVSGNFSIHLLLLKKLYIDMCQKHRTICSILRINISHRYFIHAQNRVSQTGQFCIFYEYSTLVNSISIFYFFFVGFD